MSPMANVLLLGGKDLLLIKQSPGILYGISLGQKTSRWPRQNGFGD